MGFQLCYSVPYSLMTISSPDIVDYPYPSLADCYVSEGSWLFVGAVASPQDSSFILGAFGLTSEVFRYTNDLNTARLHNGVY